MTDVTADTIALKIIVQAEQAQRNVKAYGANVQRTMVAVEASTARASAAAAAGAVKQSEAYRQLGQQLVGVATDALEGKNAFEILGRHGTEVAASFVNFGGTIGRVASFLSGPWGVAINTAVSVAGMLATKLLENEGAAERATQSAEVFASQQSDIGEYIDLTTGKIIEQNRALIDNAILLREREIRAEQAAVDAHRRTAVRAIKRAAIVEPTREERYAAERGGGTVSAHYDRKFIDILKVDRNDFEGLDRRVKELAKGRPELNDLRFTVSEAVRKAIKLRRHIEIKNTDIRALQGDRAAIEELMGGARAGTPLAPAFVPWHVPPSSAPASTEKAPPARPEFTPAEIRAGIGDPPEQLPVVISVEGFRLPTEAEAKAAAATLFEAMGGAIDLGKFEIVDTMQIEKIGKISGELTSDLSKGLADAIANGKSLGDVLVDSFARAGQALLQAKILQLLDPSGGGSAGFIKDTTNIFGSLFGTSKAPGRASGGHVSAGQLYRVNEAGIEGFRPAGSGTIVPLGQMAAQPRSGGLTVVQPLNVSFAGAITTPELMAEFKAYADSIGQAAAIGGAAMAQARMTRRAARMLPR